MSEDNIFSNPEDLFEEFEEQQRIDEEYNKIVDSWSFHDFYKKYRLLFIGYDYYPPQHRGEKVYTFQDIDGNFVKVYNMLDVSIGQIVAHEEMFSVVKRRTGYYEFLGNTFSLNVDKKIVLAFEDEWEEYDRLKDELEIIAEKKRLIQSIQRQKNRNANRFPCDLSGDDLSILEILQ